VYKGYGGMIAQQRYSPAGFKLSLGLKDVNLALEAGREKGVLMAAGHAVRDNLLRAVEQGDAELDLAALAKRSLPGRA
jgi:3-hydroxyisobutyrate dehydrogenase-like beta-hydroxyacid dehydrogenase